MDTLLNGRVYEAKYNYDGSSGLLAAVNGLLPDKTYLITVSHVRDESEAASSGWVTSFSEARVLTTPKSIIKSPVVPAVTLSGQVGALSFELSTNIMDLTFVVTVGNFRFENKAANIQGAVRITIEEYDETD